MDTSNWTVDEHIEWMHHHAKTLMVMDRLKLNVIVTTKVHYDIPWLNGFSTSHDALDVQRDLIDLGPNPVIVRHPESNTRSINV
jgi:hypothetical protein